ncbi:hypothetical protein [Actinomadura decatromicini]|nr:hypothetical protein [Actinomadura decatromicini]
MRTTGRVETEAEGKTVKIVKLGHELDVIATVTVALRHDDRVTA